MNPLQSPSPYQLLGWLTKQKSIRCEVDLPGAFQSGKNYRMVASIITLARTERRLRNGRNDIVHVEGDSQVFFVWDDASRAHTFTIKAPKFEMDRLNGISVWSWHTFVDLIHHFELPKLLDVAEHDPGEYYANLWKLTAMENP